jgi:Protein of unknown function (DUF2793)
MPATDTTPNLVLPYLMAAQAQKHVTHNEAIRMLDCLVHLSVRDRDLSAPPTSPANGDRYIVAAAPTGAWAGHAREIAAFQDDAWMFYGPREGFVVWVDDEDNQVAFDGAAWVVASAGGGGATSLNPTPLVGVNTTADTTNRLAVAAPATLFNHEGGGHQLKVNKAASANTASLLFQTGFAARAEIGTAGDDNLHVKVSDDGTTWKEALIVERATGVVQMPNTSAGFRAVCVPGTDDFSIQAGVFTTCRWSNVAFDTHNAYNAAAGVYTVPKTGRWLLTAALDCNGDANAQYAAVACVPPGATTGSVNYGFGRAFIKGGAGGASMTSVVQLTAGQQITFVRYYYGGTVTVFNNAVIPFSNISAVMLSA